MRIASSIHKHGNYSDLLMSKRRLARRVVQMVFGKYVPAMGNTIEIIGDIAIIKIKHGYEKYASQLGAALLQLLPSVRVVLRQASSTSGDWRLRSFEWVAGERRTITLHKEWSCIFKVDVARVFFTPRLSGERERVVRLVRKRYLEESIRERIVNMYAGVGTFSILIAKHASPLVIHSIDINPVAVSLMKENITLNRIDDRVVAWFGDAVEVLQNRIGDKVDRILMPLPTRVLQDLPIAAQYVTSGGIVHCYLDVFVPKGGRKEALRKAIDTVLSVASGKVLYSRIVRTVAPRVYQVVVDFQPS